MRSINRGQFRSHTSCGNGSESPRRRPLFSRSELGLVRGLSRFCPSLFPQGLVLRESLRAADGSRPLEVFVTLVDLGETRHLGLGGGMKVARYLYELHFLFLLVVPSSSESRLE